MPCHFGKNIVICTSKQYRFNGFLFEWHNYLGPGELFKNGNVKKKVSKGFWDAMDKFNELSDTEKEGYRI